MRRGYLYDLVKCRADGLLYLSSSFLLLVLIHFLYVHKWVDCDFDMCRLVSSFLFIELVAAVKSDRENRNLPFFSELECSGFEFAHLMAL